MIQRRKTRQIRIGKLSVGNESPISVQSMSNIPASETEKCVAQAIEMEKAGCDIFRFAVPAKENAKIFYLAKENGVKMPLVADIHFDYKIALECAEAGADKIRINPGNIGDDSKIREVVRISRKKGIPIRIGVNSGSLEKELLAKYGYPSPEALAESALNHARLLEKFDFYDTVISIKSSDVKNMIEANRILAAKCDYPLHIGVTEAGTPENGLLKSSVGIGSLLCDGIGDTVRVSLTAQPSEEIKAAKKILKAVGYCENGINVISCPTCGRTGINLIGLVNEFESRIGEIKSARKLTVALMGCAVNGPGEAREADIGIAGGNGEAVLIKKGDIVRKVKEDRIIDELIDEINRI